MHSNSLDSRLNLLEKLLHTTLPSIYLVVFSHCALSQHIFLSHHRVCYKSYYNFGFIPLVTEEVNKAMERMGSEDEM